MQKRVLITSFLFILLILPIVVAEISITQPNPLYNAGDPFSVDITLIPVEETSSFLAANLLCSGESLELYRSPVFLSAGEEKKITISSKFDPFLIQKLQGSCLIKTTFGEETRNTEVFTLSRNLAVNVTVSQSEFNPGESVVINGKATKEDGSPISGIVEVSSEDILSSDAAGISEGIFSINLLIPETTPAGSKLVKIEAFQRNSKNETLNQGKTVISIIINQIASEFDIVIDSQSIVPKNDLKYNVLILDQTSAVIQEPVLLTITDSQGSVFSEQQVQSSTDLTIPIESNFIPGEWTLKTSYKDKEIERQFIVEEFKDLSYEIIGGELTVTNTGNVQYEDILEIKIGEDTQSFDITLGIGKSKIYKLSAPDGDYDVSVSTPQGSQNVGSASLTGNVVSVSSLSLGGIDSGLLKILIWAVIIILLIILFFFIRKKVKSGSFSRKKKLKLTPEESQQDMSKDETIADGKKEHSTLISLKIKNYDTIKNNKEAREAINSALIKAKEVKAKVYVSENYRIVILSPIITQNKENEIEAVSIAGKIKEIINKYNKHAHTKIRFGLGIHSGELVLESSKGQTKFTSLGNTISMVKNISESSESEIFISEPVRKKILGKIRAEKVSNKLWKIADLKSKYKYEEFIKRFEQRRRESSKKE